MNPFFELNKLGQSVWYEGLRKAVVTSGALKRMSDEYAVSGVIFDPSAFEHALAGTSEYDDDASRLLKEGLDDRETAWRLLVADAALAADSLTQAYRSSKGLDGLVAVHVDPALASDSASIISEAKRLADAVGRQNVMISVPATQEGLVAAEQLVFDGMHVNLTPLFSADRYADAAWAYVRGLERRAAAGMPLGEVSGAAGFMISCVDTAFDRILEGRASRSKSNDERARLRELIGKVAVANARMVWVKREEVFSSQRFKKLKDAGARPQRLLFTSTCVKNPQYAETKYATELVWPGTISAMQLYTVLALRSSAKAAPVQKEDAGASKKVFEALEALGVDFAAATARLEAKASEALVASFDGIARAVGEKRETLGKKDGLGARFSLGAFSGAVSEAAVAAHGESFLERLWAKDPTLWKSGPDDKRLIKNSLGWICLPYTMGEHADEIIDFAGEVRAAGFKDIVLLGMGGSSLAPLVFASTFGRAPGHPGLIVLDSTDPEALAAVEKKIDIANTLFVVSSKSGSTIEPLSLFEYFHEALSAIKGDEAGRNFVAITDPGTALEGFCKKYRFRKVFINPKDIGGRFSALSYFGLVPAALTGVDISRLVEHALRVAAAVHPCASAADNPVMLLGAALGRLALEGRDKLTLVLSREIESFGMWIEQLVAESTGKEGRGIVPLSGEPIGAPGGYGDDRLFVSITLGRHDEAAAGKLKALAEAGHPVIELRLKDTYELGGEFLRWEVATAMAGRILGINPFDQPDVELAKKLAVSRLSHAGAQEALAPPGVEVAGEGFSLHLGNAAASTMDLSGAGLSGALKGFLGLLKKGDYVGVMAYYDPFDDAVGKELAAIRTALSEATGAATQFGYGPRYLHSTGQLHKGRPDCGLFFIFCHGPRTDFDVPGSAFSFSRLELSQAFGDMEALDSKGARVVLVYMKDPAPERLNGFAGLLRGAPLS